MNNSPMSCLCAARRPCLISPEQTSPELCLLPGSGRDEDWSRERGWAAMVLIAGLRASSS